MAGFNEHLSTKRQTPAVPAPAGKPGTALPDTERSGAERDKPLSAAATSFAGGPDEQEQPGQPQ